MGEGGGVGRGTCIVSTMKDYNFQFDHIYIFLGYVSTRRLTNVEVRRKRNELFDLEKQRQTSLVQRVEKIEVQYNGLPELCTLIMNKGMSTPYNCAMRKFAVGNVLFHIVIDMLFPYLYPYTTQQSYIYIYYTSVYTFLKLF